MIVPAVSTVTAKRLRGEKKLFCSAKKVAERQASENDHQNTRNLLNGDSCLNWPTLLCEQSRFYN